MLYNIKHEFVVNLFRIPFKKFFNDYKVLNIKDDPKVFNSNFNKTSTGQVKVQSKLGRNEICYCNSGKKYKYCHGKNI
ncbi:MAG TPA: SEC-C metal-binding domain-containing protein [Candidatus Azoamicus sp.]